jgi:hypothetical protein
MEEARGRRVTRRATISGRAMRLSARERERKREAEGYGLMGSHSLKTPTFLSPTLLRKGNLSRILFYKMIHPPPLNPVI